MKRFSKKGYGEEAICPSCGDWKTTDFSPAELQEREWECSDCMNKRLTNPQDLPENRGSNEVSKYDPEYEFLVKLIQLVTKEGVPPQEVKALAEAHPFVTIDDVGDLSAQIWTLATEKYHIKREWLIKHLPKNASLKTADLYPAQKETEDMINHAPGYIAYEYGQDKEADGEFKGSEFSGTDAAPNPTTDIGPWSSPEDHGKKPQKSPFPNTNWLPADDQNLDQQAPSNVAASLNKKAYDEGFWIDPNGKTYQVRDSESGFITHDEWINEHKDMLANDYGIEISDEDIEYSAPRDLNNILIENGWTRIGDSGNADIGIRMKDLRRIPRVVEDTLYSFYNGGKISLEDLNGKHLEIKHLDQDLQKIVNQSLVRGTLDRPFSKKANPPARFWIAPDGTEFEVPAAGHGAWIRQNAASLKQYGIDTKDVRGNLYGIYQQMYNQGWVRISNEPWGNGFQIELNDVNRIPSYVEDFVARNFADGDTIKIGNSNRGQYAEITEPFPSLQKAVTKQLRRRSSLKQAAVSGDVTNKILMSIHNNGGTTYNLSQGDMNGTPNYSVSIYPDRERIVDGVDFDVLEGFLDENEDLLKDPSNSFGAWSNAGKVYLDIVQTIPDREKAIELARQHNQIAIWDLQNSKEIPTGGTGGGNIRSFSKKEIVKIAMKQPLSEVDQNAIAAASSPAYVMAVNNYAEAVKRGHSKDRAVEYAIESVQNVEKIDPKKLVEFINNYVV